MRGIDLYEIVTREDLSFTLQRYNGYTGLLNTRHKFVMRYTQCHVCYLGMLKQTNNDSK